MDIYVDNLRHNGMRFGTKPIRSCHLIYLGSDLEELHEFAESIGCRRSWFHKDHYDLVGTFREKAINAGAIEIEIDDPKLYKQYLKGRRGVKS
jgi:hypothetical protein